MAGPFIRIRGGEPVDVAALVLCTQPVRLLAACGSKIVYRCRSNPGPDAVAPLGSTMSMRGFGAGMFGAMADTCPWRSSRAGDKPRTSITAAVLRRPKALIAAPGRATATPRHAHAADKPDRIPPSQPSDEAFNRNPMS